RCPARIHPLSRRIPRPRESRLFVNGVHLIKDVTAALRARRYRRSKKTKDINSGVTVEDDGGRVVNAVEMCELAGRIVTDRATDDDREMAGRLILELVRRLPECVAVTVSGPPDSAAMNSARRMANK